ncbi:MAG: hypothetical protein IIU87_00685 [Prevotella sp.]|nr:hypothetical protein [Prevotella sp.]
MITILWHCHRYAIMARWLFYHAVVAMPSYRHNDVIVLPLRCYRVVMTT